MIEGFSLRLGAVCRESTAESRIARLPSGNRCHLHLSTVS